MTDGTPAEGIRMSAPDDTSAADGLRRWWLSPPRPGMQRLISPWEYRHLRGFCGPVLPVRVSAAGAGVVCLAYGAYGWAAFFLVVGALNLGGGYWYLSIARRRSGSLSGQATASE